MGSCFQAGFYSSACCVCRWLFCCDKLWRALYGPGREWHLLLPVHCRELLQNPSISRVPCKERNILPSGLAGFKISCCYSFIISSLLLALLHHERLLVLHIQGCNFCRLGDYTAFEVKSSWHLSFKLSSNWPTLKHTSLVSESNRNFCSDLNLLDYEPSLFSK